MVTNINDRIKRLITIHAVSPSTFAATVGVNATVIFNIIKGRKSKPSYDLILKILRNYDGLSAEWLIKGNGAMWKNALTDVVVPSIRPLNYELGDRIMKLFEKMEDSSLNPYMLKELKELVSFILEEGKQQQRRLTYFYARKERILQQLREILMEDVESSGKVSEKGRSQEEIVAVPMPA